MNGDRYAAYEDRLREAPSELVRGRILLEAARDHELTTTEFMRLDSWAKRLNKRLKRYEKK